MSAGAVASHQIDVRIFPAFRGKASGPRLRLVAQQALEAGHGPTNVSLSLSLALADDETVRRLNRDYRGLDETTDVLAFAFHHPGHYEGEGEPPPIPEDDPFTVSPQGEDFLGEVVISYPQCVRQAQSEGRNIDEELALLVTHASGWPDQNWSSNLPDFPVSRLNNSTFSKITAQDQNDATASNTITACTTQVARRNIAASEKSIPFTSGAASAASVPASCAAAIRAAADNPYGSIFYGPALVPRACAALPFVTLPLHGSRA